MGLPPDSMASSSVQEPSAASWKLVHWQGFCRPTILNKNTHPVWKKSVLIFQPLFPLYRIQATTTLTSSLICGTVFPVYCTASCCMCWKGQFWSLRYSDFPWIAWRVSRASTMLQQSLSEPNISFESWIILRLQYLSLVYNLVFLAEVFTRKKWKHDFACFFHSVHI